MDRWKQTTTGFEVDGDHFYLGNPLMVGAILDYHHKDCDAYEARIAELERQNAIYQDRLDALDRHCVDGIRIDVAALCSQLEDHRECIAELEANAILDAGIECDLKTQVHKLRAELVRVRAESLRVVPVASMYGVFGSYSCGYFRYDGQIWHKDRHDPSWGYEINHNNHKAFADSEPVEWFRLERWEDEG